jgi:hypothetical protein
MNKKGQSQEFIGIAILVLVLTLIVMFNKIGSDRARLGQMETTQADSSNIWVSTSATKFSFITEKGIPISELLGDYVCYEDQIYDNGLKVDYGVTIGTIDIDATIRRELDKIYEPDKWLLDIDERACIDSKEFKREKCNPIGKEYYSFEFMFPRPCDQDMSRGKIYIITR